jgi:hypothetical protein
MTDSVSGNDSRRSKTEWERNTCSYTTIAAQVKRDTNVTALNSTYYQNRLMCASTFYHQNQVTTSPYFALKQTHNSHVLLKRKPPQWSHFMGLSNIYKISKRAYHADSSKDLCLKFSLQHE